MSQQSCLLLDRNSTLQNESLKFVDDGDINVASKFGYCGFDFHHDCYYRLTIAFVASQWKQKADEPKMSVKSTELKLYFTFLVASQVIHGGRKILSSRWISLEPVP